jgi:hypothetical protein
MLCHPTCHKACLDLYLWEYMKELVCEKESQRCSVMGILDCVSAMQNSHQSMQEATYTITKLACLCIASAVDNSKQPKCVHYVTTCIKCPCVIV